MPKTAYRCETHIWALSAFLKTSLDSSASAVNKFELSDSINHVSTGGGATLELIEKGDLPGLKVLRESRIES